MSLKPVVRAATALRKAAVQACWTQWSAVSAGVPTERPAQAIVDPEALVLASMALADHEPRLWRVCRMWAPSGSRLLSVQRIKNLNSGGLAVAEARLAEFAWVATAKGNDKRWHKLAGSEPPRVSRRESTAAPVVNQPAALMLRLRLGLGVGIKPDVLSFLLGIAGGHATIQQITQATHYYGRAVRRAVEELTAAGFVQSRSTAPASFRVDMKRWQHLMKLDLDNPPAWRPWARIYGFVIALSQWVKHGLSEAESVAASEARDIMTTHSGALEAAGISPIPADRYPGAELLGPFEEALEEYVEYVNAVV